MIFPIGGVRDQRNQQYEVYDERSPDGRDPGWRIRGWPIPWRWLRTAAGDECLVAGSDLP